MGYAKQLSQLLNSQNIRKNSFFLPYTKTLLKLSKILKKEGFISHFKFSVNAQKIKLYLKQESKKTNFSIISKASLLKYLSKSDLWKFSNRLGLYVLSTPKGMLSNKEAQFLQIGGKILFFIF